MAATRIYRAAGFVLTEHEFTVPLDHDRPDGLQLTVFGREICDSDDHHRPLLLYLQGGPGMEAVRPTRRPPEPSWLGRALTDYRVLMLDQRGTGRSTPVGALAACRLLSKPCTSATSGLTRSFVTPSDPPRARGRAVERARSELWRLLRHCLSLARSRRSARGIHHRWTASHRAPHGRGLRTHLPEGARAEPPLLRSLSRRSGACARGASADRGGGARAPGRRSADVTPVPAARAAAGQERRRREAPLPARVAPGLARIPSRRRDGAPVCP